jgi:lactate dehydrogenase-like 2-hydroxyacid dehydrogenase
MKHRILQITPLLPALDARLNEQFDVQLMPPSAEVPAFVQAHGTEFVGLVTSAISGASAELMAALPNLRVISSFGVGFDKVDIPYAQGRGIPVGTTPGVLDDCVADLALTLLLDVARGASASDRFVRRGDWLKGRAPLGTRVSGKRMGILGMGRIGEAVARRASGFEMTVGYHNRREVPGSGFEYLPSPTALAAWADFLVVVVAGGAATRHLVSKDVLDALGPQGFLINVARGSVIDEAALVQALIDKRIAGAGLDVFDDEPNVPEALFALDNVVLLPHIASGTFETRQAMADRVFDNLHGFFETGKVRSGAY